MKKTFGTGIRALALTITALAACLGTASAQITTIYSHSFGGSGAALNGTAVDIGGQNWQAGSAYLDNGTVNTVVASSANGQAAWLPFTPYAGYEYTATATIVNNFADWIAFGFLPAAAPGGVAWTATDYRTRHSNAGGYAWALDRNNATNPDQQGFNGSGTANPAFSGDLFNPAQPLTISILLNTRDAIWTAQYFLNGIQQGGTFNLLATANTGIGGIGFSRDRNATAGTGGIIDTFTLTSVPEPSTAALLGLFGLASVFRMRRIK